MHAYHPVAGWCDDLLTRLRIGSGSQSVYVTDRMGSRATGGGLPWAGDDAQGFVLKLPAG